MISKDIVISYSDSDKDQAKRLYDVLQNLFEQRIWIKELDLNGGDLVAEILNDVYSSAKWLIVLLRARSLTTLDIGYNNLQLI